MPTLTMAVGFLASLADKLTQEYGDGFATKNLRHMIRFAEVFPDEQIVSRTAET